ncbi:MAG: hypothetical protein K2F77_04230, partial [Muribaculaceae bacterium]|nr:hypothetical protein [Muribaculaceae bacterium]
MDSLAETVSGIAVIAARNSVKNPFMGIMFFKSLAKIEKFRFKCNCCGIFLPKHAKETPINRRINKKPRNLCGSRGFVCKVRVYDPVSYTHLT